MKETRFHGERLIHGLGSLSVLSELSGKTVLIVTGKGSMERTGVLDKVKDYLSSGFENVFVHKISGINPTDEMVMRGLEVMKSIKPDYLVALGGGSPIDCAKAMLVMYENPQYNISDLPNIKIPNKRETRFVVIPSTSGTASEVTHISVITYTESKLKIAIKSFCLRPDIAILDGEIPVTMPKSVCAQTGMDALTHAIESYICSFADDYTDALAKAAIEGIVEWLPISYETESSEARQKVHDFQCMAGMAFSNSGLGAVHGISHAFSGIYNTPHGLANAVILPYVMKYNCENSKIVYNKLEKLSKVLGENIIVKVVQMNKAMNIPFKMRETGISVDEFEKEFETIVKYSMMGATTQNPVKITEEAIRKIIRDCF